MTVSSGFGCKVISIRGICCYEMLAKNETQNAARYLKTHGLLVRQPKTRGLVI